MYAADSTSCGDCAALIASRMAPLSAALCQLKGSSEVTQPWPSGIVVAHHVDLYISCETNIGEDTRVCHMKNAVQAALTAGVYETCSTECASNSASASSRPGGPACCAVQVLARTQKKYRPGRPASCAVQCRHAAPQVKQQARQALAVQQTAGHRPTWHGKAQAACSPPPTPALTQQGPAVPHSAGERPTWHAEPRQHAARPRVPRGQA